MKLRPHHLLCTQGYSGKGYNEGFVENMTAITNYLRSDESVSVEIVLSTDDIFSKCPKMLGVDFCEDNDKIKRFDKKVLMLFMERTPKVITMFKNISPQSILVGFKLLDSVPHDTLINTGLRVLQENKCSFVLANDLKDISENNHVGYLINSDMSFTKHDTKKEIASAIVDKAIAKVRGI
jgi:hypothetical protein